jgi:hypothetical protein
VLTPEERLLQAQLELREAQDRATDAAAKVFDAQNELDQIRKRKP